MKPHIPIHQSWSAVSLVGMLLSSMIVGWLMVGLPGQNAFTKSVSLSNSQAPNNLDSPTSSQPIQTPPNVGLPVRLKIPVLKVDAAIESVGLTPEGAMDVPHDPADVAWYSLGQRPGELGSAVMAGHYGSKDGRPAAFDSLHSLAIGASVLVEDETGGETAFIVREIRQYDPKADASDVFNFRDGEAHLNLVTCKGVWDTAQQGYTKRLVIFTDQE